MEMEKLSEPCNAAASARVAILHQVRRDAEGLAKKTDNRAKITWRLWLIESLEACNHVCPEGWLYREALVQAREIISKHKEDAS